MQYGLWFIAKQTGNRGLDDTRTEGGDICSGDVWVTLFVSVRRVGVMLHQKLILFLCYLCRMSNQQRDFTSMYKDTKLWYLTVF